MFRVGVALLTAIPPGIAYRLASGLGRLAYHVDVRHRRETLHNLDLAYGDSLDGAAKRRIAVDAFRSLAMVALDVAWIPKLLRPETRDRYVTIDDLAPVHAARAEKSQAIYVTPHYGSWEAVSSIMATMGHSFRAVARPLPNPRINAYVVRAREALGQRVMGKFGAVNEMIRCLRAGESLGFVADQDARRQGILVHFFGQVSSTIPTPAILAARFDLPVIVGCARRVGAGFRFHIPPAEILRVDPTLPRQEAVRDLTQRINDSMERAIRAEPGQYLWLHRRWKTRPEKVKRG